MSRSDEILPADVDVVVLGTGLPESILAAACSRAGFSVLHLDRNEYYGGSWASFNLEGILKWAEEQTNQSNSSSSTAALENVQLQDGERLCPVSPIQSTMGPGVHFSNVEIAWHLPKDEQTMEPSPAAVSSADADSNEKIEVQDQPSEIEPQIQEDVDGESKPEIPATAEKKNQSEQWTQDRVMQDWRRFSLDLAPKVLLGRGSMVDLLSQSNVGRYAEFRSVNRLLTFYEGSLKVIPCSRSDVFQSTEITMIEKRMLMKFLTFCLNYETETERLKWDAYAQTSFTAYLASSGQQLTEKLRHYILHALAMVSPEATTNEALKSINEFLMSTGRYGSSPFLWTMYGSGELPQCFCRLCAVFGGVYCLRRSVDAWILDADGNCIGIVSDGHRVTCRKLVTDGSYLPRDLVKESNLEKSAISRAILITDKPMIKADGKENVSLLNYYTDHLPEPVKILESGFSGCVSPAGLHVVQVTTKGNDQLSAKSDLKPVLQKFFRISENTENSETPEDDRPQVLWSLFFNCTSVSVSSNVAGNVTVTPTLDGQLTYAELVPRLKAEFVRQWPDAEFLPSPPNPEEASDGSDPTPNDPGVNGFAPDP